MQSAGQKDENGLVMDIEVKPVCSNRTASLVCRAVQAGDLSAIHAIQAESYSPSMQEGMDVICRRIEAANETCWIALDDFGPCGYLFAYPSTLGTVTPLGGDFSVSFDADTLYLHDLAVLRRVAGRGVGNALFTLALDTARARGLDYSGLVSVQGSRNYWIRQGYEVCEPAPACAALLRDYPADSVYMTRRLCMPAQKP